MVVVRRVVRHADGSEEVFLPYKDKHNRYMLYAKQTNDPMNHESNKILIESEDEMIQMMKTMKYRLRMTSGATAPSIIAPKSIEILE